MNLKSFLLTAAAVMISATTDLQAQAVIFPQQQQPGISVLTANDNSWTLSNEILSASFTATEGRLLFGGCEAMGLQPGTELFFVELADGGIIPASKMNMGAVTTEKLTADTSSPRGSDHFDGNAICTTFGYGDLRISWRAILRDGSHYLRTEMVLTSDQGTRMKAIIPMYYTVSEGEPTLEIVGNTRGAILASTKVFAGLETPMGINSVGSKITIPDGDIEAPKASDGFTLKSWRPEMFCWEPGRELPSQIIALGYGDNEVVGAYGRAYFASAGTQTVTFKYSSGSHRLNIVGVDLQDENDNIVASDYHYGYTGNMADANVYTLNLPESGIYKIRYFIEIKSETITSSGNISFSGDVTAVDDGSQGSTATLPESGMDRFWVFYSDRGSDPRYVTEADGGLMGNSRYSEASKWHFMSRADGSWDIINAETGNYIITGAANNSQLKTGASAPASGWQIKPSDNNNAWIIVNGNSQFNSTNASWNFQIFNWGSGTNTSDLGCQYYFEEVAESSEFFAEDTPISGRWSRNTTLQPGKTWKVSAVVGLIAQGQARRSVLAYSERERAMAWRPMPIYNSWYELNINRNNDINYTGNFNINQCVDVLNQWKKNLYDKYDAHIQSFVWDDGWDHYGTWTFNPNFPNGFTEADDVAKAMGSNIGAWLGPVGGYGQSGNYRRSYWNDKGDMQLSNPAYYQTFLDAVTMLTTSYNFNYFKFDGISAQFSSVGPDAGTTGEENAEAIIDIEQRVREIKPDIFLNTTVGTWASPFWYQYADATWRQENDFGKTGPGNDREQWITYRDRLVHQNYVINSPLCPINSLMTHGFILTKFGSTANNREYRSVLNELRCAFACGSSQVELYADYALLNEIEGGKLWGDIAECIKWQEEMADVLPDSHWVGGNPWANNKAEVYGWASWNGKRATLALRNGTDAQSYTFTLREALDIPEYISTSITLTPSFSDIPALYGLDYGTPIDIDRELTVNMPAYSVYVFNGLDANTGGDDSINEISESTPLPEAIYDLQGRRCPVAGKGIYIINGVKTLKH